MNKITGMRFGKLIALEPTDRRQSGCIIWKCQCDCGNICYINSHSLKTGNTKSCGCLNNEKRIERINKYNEKYIRDITNQRFGKLLALEPTQSRSGSNIIWKCQCECGNITYVSNNNLLKGTTKSCGCLKKSFGEELITKILTENNISFNTQKTFENCIFPTSKRKAKFDFYINNQYLIEYDGEQHYKITSYEWDSQEDFEERKIRDQYKNQWCKDNNIPLIRIPYWHLNELNIKDLLLETSNYII